MKKNPVETILGVIVLVVAAVFLWFAYSMSDLRPVKGYEVAARFYKSGGLEVGSDVRLSGIKVGSVTSVHLDNEEYNADVKMSILPEVKLPKDSMVEIASAGLMGGMFVNIAPGQDRENYMKDGDSFGAVKDYTSLEDKVGKIIFMVTDDKKSSEE